MRMKAPVLDLRYVLGSSLAVALLLAVSCGRKSESPVLARVGLSEIRVEQFQEQLIRRSGGRPEAVDKEALLQELIDQEALYLRALKAGLDKDPELQRTWRNLLIAKLKERELGPRIAAAQVTQGELEQSYAAAGSRNLRPPSVRLAALCFKTDSATKPEKIAQLKERMAAAREKALAQDPGAPGFGSLAITNSEDQATRYKGGVLGWVEQGRGHAWLSPGALEAGFALKRQGDISDVVTDSKGIYLLKLLERRETTVVSLAEAEASLRQRLLKEKRRSIEQAYISELRQSVGVEAHPELLPSVSLPPSGAVAESKQPPAFP